MLKKLVLVIFCIFPLQAFASNYQEGVEAYQKGKIQEAMKIWHEAAKEGDVSSQYQFGSQHLLGINGVTKDYAIAYKWLNKAAIAGQQHAQYNLAQMFANGWHVEKDEKLALILYESAGAKGHAKAQNNAGTYHYNGWGTKKDYKSSLYWHKLAAQQGHAGAQDDVGRQYFFGHGVKKDLKESFKWYSKAAIQGNHNPQLSLGIAYSNGLGVKNNDIKGYMWVSVSVQNHETKVSRQLLTELQKKLPKSYVQKGRALAKKCLQRQYKAC